MAILGMTKDIVPLPKPDRVIQFNREESLVMSYNIKENKAVACKITPGFILPFRFVAIKAENNIYIIGGDNENGYYLKSIYLYDELRGILISLANMSAPRSRHTAVSVDHSIIVMGGENNDGVLSSCEKYDIDTNTWKFLPELNIKRCGLSSCIMNEWIYAGFGWNNNPLNTIEGINMEKIMKWEIIKCKNIEPIQVPGMIPISDTEILIFGGYKEEKLDEESYILNSNVLCEIKEKTGESFYFSMCQVFKGSFKWVCADFIYTRHLH